LRRPNTAAAAARTTSVCASSAAQTVTGGHRVRGAPPCRANVGGDGFAICGCRPDAWQRGHATVIVRKTRAVARMIASGTAGTAEQLKAGCRRAVRGAARHARAARRSPRDRRGNWARLCRRAGGNIGVGCFPLVLAPVLRPGACPRCLAPVLRLLTAPYNRFEILPGTCCEGRRAKLRGVGGLAWRGQWRVQWRGVCGGC